MKWRGAGRKKVEKQRWQTVVKRKEGIKNQAVSCERSGSNCNVHGEKDMHQCSIELAISTPAPTHPPIPRTYLSSCGRRTTRVFITSR